MLSVDPTVSFAIVAAGALLFAAAGVHKLLVADGFVLVLQHYELVPELLVKPAARLLPMVEIVIACSLVLPATRTWAAGAGAALITVYALGIGINLRRGRRELDCGCGFGKQRTIGNWMVWRNCVIAALLLATLLPWSAREWHWIDALTALCTMSVLALLYLALDALWTRPAPHAPRSYAEESTP